MKLTIDTVEKTLLLANGEGTQKLPLYSKQSFEILSEQWIAVGWDQKYPYTFSWMGRPIIQLPEDMIRMQEVIYQVKPSLIIETGVAHGGSLIFYASLFKMMGLDNSRVVGVDIEIRPNNRKAIEAHALSHMISLIEGDSVAHSTADRIKSIICPQDKVLVILDSCHTKDHVLKELELYHQFVSKDSYIVATDGVMQWVSDTSRAQKDWIWNNPSEAAKEFEQSHPDFKIVQPSWLFNESPLTQNVTHWPYAWLKRN